MTDAGWVSISECTRLYGKSRKWVYDQVNRYGITTKTSDTDNKVLLQLADMIAYRGEPPSSGTLTTVQNHIQESRIITPQSTPAETALLEQEIWFLRDHIA